jgi:hypothetical protein
MQAYYNVLDKIKTTLELDDFVNTVTQGNLFDIDLKKQTIFPLSHIMVESGTIADRTINFSISVVCMDIVDKSSELTTNDFRGNDNEQDVLNTQLAVAVRLSTLLKRGEDTNLYQIVGEPNLEPFTERFENYLAGWVVTFEIQLPNTMTVC